MSRVIAGILRHILQFQPSKARQLPASPRQNLRADLIRLLSLPYQSWQFQVPPGLGLEATLADIFQVYGALRYLYTGEKSKLHMVGRVPTIHCPWLEIVPGQGGIKAIRVNNDGSLACFLPQLPPELCFSHQQRQYHITLDLLTWLAQRLWNFSNLREGQYPVVQRLCQGQNSLAILPTGAGKSLCFQLPAMLLPGITLVVSPLKSLMRDQFTNLTKAGITGVDFIDSSKSASEKQATMAHLKAGKIKLLYLSPERLQIQSFQEELAETLVAYPISLFAIDEAHCISEWGHDFRPSYLRLRQFIARLHQPPVCALTATASQYVRQDILTLLGLNNQDVIMPKSLDRREISLQVKILDRDDDYHREITNIVSTEIPQILGSNNLDSIHLRGAGVVFCPYAAPLGKSTRPLGTETIALLLKNQGLDCRHYHAQMPDEQRIAIQDQFKDNSFPLLAATKGYGMGIDKENIDYVVHICPPASLEAYYQEAGRAGRDGEHAHSVIIARPRLQKCEEKNLPLPPCHRGWKCEYTGEGKCSYGIQAGLLALEYPTEQEIAQDFSRFLDHLAQVAVEKELRYVCRARNSARHQKYLYYLQQLGALVDYKVLEYRRVADNQYDVLLQGELAGPDSLDNKYWLVNKVVEKIQTYKAQKLNMLNTVQLYIKSRQCRRRFLMQYFGDEAQYVRCNFCDNDGISRDAAPAPRLLPTPMDLRDKLERALGEQDLALAFKLVQVAKVLEMEDAITVRSLRELEDRPHNPAALFLAGIFACQDPTQHAYGLRNLQGAVDKILGTPQHLTQLFAHLTAESPATAYTLAQRYLDQMDPVVLGQIAAGLEPPEQYPDVHLTLLLPQLEQINQLLKKEVPHEHQ